MIEFYVALGMSWVSGLFIGIYIGHWYVLQKWKKSITLEDEFSKPLERDNHN